jgi:hypothetical protein
MNASMLCVPEAPGSSGPAIKTVLDTLSMPTELLACLNAFNGKETHPKAKLQLQFLELFPVKIEIGVTCD